VEKQLQLNSEVEKIKKENSDLKEEIRKNEEMIKQLN
jgi:hypothetical protein